MFIICKSVISFLELDYYYVKILRGRMAFVCGCLFVIFMFIGGSFWRLILTSPTGRSLIIVGYSLVKTGYGHFHNIGRYLSKTSILAMGKVLIVEILSNGYGIYILNLNHITVHWVTLLWLIRWTRLGKHSFTNEIGVTRKISVCRMRSRTFRIMERILRHKGIPDREIHGVQLCQKYPLRWHLCNLEAKNKALEIRALDIIDPVKCLHRDRWCK